MIPRVVATPHYLAAVPRASGRRPPSSHCTVQVVFLRRSGTVPGSTARFQAAPNALYELRQPPPTPLSLDRTPPAESRLEQATASTPWAMAWEWGEELRIPGVSQRRTIHTSTQPVLEVMLQLKASAGLNRRAAAGRQPWQRLEHAPLEPSATGPPRLAVIDAVRGSVSAPSPLPLAAVSMFSPEMN